jgi:hypothetical protein
MREPVAEVTARNPTTEANVRAMIESPALKADARTGALP